MSKLGAKKQRTIPEFPIFTLIMTFFLTSLCSFSQTIIIGGFVSGSWTSSGSPYLVQGDLLVHPDSSLAIGEGTLVLFTGQYMLEVQGQLQVNGTAASPVIFDRENDTVSWRGIFINYTDTSMTDSSIMVHGVISHTFGGSCLTIDHSSRLRVSFFTLSYGESFRGSGINCRFSSPRLDHLMVEHNHALDGAGISLEGSQAQLLNCTIRLNVADGAGGGMVIFDQSAPFLDSCTIEINSSYGSGGGIYINNSWPVIKNSIIAHNNGAQGGGTNYSGGGISVKLNSEPVFENCKINSNTSWGNGGGIASFSPSHLVNCLFFDNFSYGEGGAVYLGSANPVTSKLTNCTFDHNSAPYGAIIACYNHVALCRNSILWDKWNSNPASMIYLTSFPALQAADIDYCDVIHGESCIQLSGNAGYAWGEHNTTQYPGWEATGFALSWDSPCIEAGTPDTSGLGLPATDLDGNPRIVNTRVDMGAFEYQQPVAVQSSIRQLADKVQSRMRIYPNPVNGDFFVEISEEAGNGWLQIYDISGRIISSKKAGPGVMKMSAEGFEKGLFLVRFSRDDISHSEKLIIR